MKLSGKMDFLDEAVPVYRPADCLCPQQAAVTRKMGISEQTF
jgi:hypothetical protein